jgi:hypothetical protein
MNENLKGFGLLPKTPQLLGIVLFSLTLATPARAELTTIGCQDIFSPSYYDIDLSKKELRFQELDMKMPIVVSETAIKWELPSETPDKLPKIVYTLDRYTLLLKASRLERSGKIENVPFSESGALVSKCNIVKKQL